jgi:hypothetical protein
VRLKDGASVAERAEAVKIDRNMRRHMSFGKGSFQSSGKLLPI